MPAAPLPEDELIRIKALADLEVLDTSYESEFDALVQAAALVCDVPISLISLVDTERQWFKANIGLPGVTETPREMAFCAYTIHDDGILEVEDATRDSRFNDNPLVKAEPNIRFYAGASLCLSGGANVGTLCVIDIKPRKLDDKQRAILNSLAKAAVGVLEGRRALVMEHRTLKQVTHLASQPSNSEARFRILCEASPLGIFSTDAIGRCTYTNARWQEIYGLTLAQSLGYGWQDGLHPDDKPHVSNTWSTSANEGLEFDFEFRTINKNGDTRYVHSRAKSIVSAGSGVIGYVGSVEDITQHKMLAQENSALLNTIRAQFIMSITNTKGKIVEVNDSFCAISKYSREELIGSNHRIINSGSHPREFFTDLWQTISKGKFWRSEICNRAKDGTMYWVDSVITPLKNAAGEIDRYVSIRRDITERMNQRLLLEETHNRMSLATNSGEIGVWEYNITHGTLVWDEWMYKLYGLSPTIQSEVYELWIKHLHPDDKGEAEKALSDAIAGIAPFNTEFRIIWSDSSIHHLRAAAQVIRDEQDNALRMIGVNWDVSRLRRLTEELAEQHELMRITLKSIGDAVITTDAQGNTQWMNPVAEHMTGWTNEEAKGRPLPQVFHIVNEETRLLTENPVALCMKQGKVVGLANHTILISRDGDEFGIEDSAAPIRNERGDLLGVVLVFHDVTEQRRLSGEVRHQASHDALTGLVNRAEFEVRLRRILQSTHGNNSQHALMYIDLDQFKVVNDTCGHSVGDQLLQQISQLLNETVRTRDTLARLGGGEFGVLLEHCSTGQAQRFAQQICDKMEDFRFHYNTHRFRIGTSIGLVAIDNRWQTTTELMQAADTSCYAAKDAGRNRVHMWFDTDQAMHTRHGEMQWTTRIERALDENHFQLHAQRIVDLSDTSNGIHAKVLLRMLDTDGTIIPPGAFLPAAERFHLASRIDRWVLRSVIKWLSARSEDDPTIDMLCINFSGQSIGDRIFHRQATEMLSEAGSTICEKICLEITETAAVTNLADASIFIEQVNQLGVRVALDDFGAGASSFGYLKNLAVDILKIDGQFIKDLVDNPLDDVAVRCFIDVARVVGLKTVAEFVDKPAVLSRVRELGIDYAQGFLVHKPEPIDRLTELSSTTA